MKKIRLVALAFAFILCCLLPPMKNVYAGTLYESPYVEFSPGGYAWTVVEELPYTNYAFNYSLPDNIPEYWYGPEEEIDTGIESKLRALQIGEHYYNYDRVGEVPVGYWKVNQTIGSCIHDCFWSSHYEHRIYYFEKYAVKFFVELHSIFSYNIYVRCRNYVKERKLILCQIYYLYQI